MMDKLTEWSRNHIKHHYYIHECENSLMAESPFYVINYTADAVKLDRTVTEKMCRLLPIKKKEYINMMIGYGAKLSKGGELIFCNRADAEQALEWVKSVELLDKLRGEDDEIFPF